MVGTVVGTVMRTLTRTLTRTMHVHWLKPQLTGTARFANVSIRSVH
ncbi:hypothetical protein [Cupriavidus basilensis]|nr:hypothetical protein [Cupriavidus basilensis]